MRRRPKRVNLFLIIIAFPVLVQEYVSLKYYRVAGILLMRRIVFSIAVVLATCCLTAQLYAQVPMEELTSPYKRTSCSDLVTPQSLVEKSQLVFTGSVLKRKGSYTWFRVYAILHGSYKSRILKATGFDGRENYIPGTGPSFEVGHTYTVSVRPPETKEERKMKTPWLNALDECGSSVLATAHSRYGLYRVEEKDLEPGRLDFILNSLYFYRTWYLLLAACLSALGVAAWRYSREHPGKIGEIMNLPPQKPDERQPPEG